MEQAIAFDTYAYVKKLKSVGFTEEQAAVIVESHVDLLEKRLASKRDIIELKKEITAMRGDSKRNLEELKKDSKRDIVELRNELKRDIEELRTELKRDIEELRTELKRDLEELRNELKKDIEELRNELKKDIKELELSFDAKISAQKVDLIKWVVGIAFAQATLIIALIKFL